MAVTAALSPSSLPQSSTGRLVNERKIAEYQIEQMLAWRHALA
jgi:hypothetical protein